MKKIVKIIMALMCLSLLVGCSGREVNIDNEKSEVKTIATNSTNEDSTYLRGNRTTDLIEMVHVPLANELIEGLSLQRVYNKLTNEIMFLFTKRVWLSEQSDIESTAIRIYKLDDMNKYMEKEYLKISAENTYDNISQGISNDNSGIITLIDEYLNKKITIYINRNGMSIDDTNIIPAVQ